MIWQDIILSCGSFIFFGALIPTVLGKDKPAFSTSLVTGTVLIVFAAVYATLSLWLSMITTLMTSLLWLILAVQKYRTSTTKPVSTE